MSYNNAFNQYKENSIQTASPEELTLMLYNGLVKFIMQAQMHVVEKNIEKANNSIIKAQNIIVEFQTTLDMRYSISNDLMKIYDYMHHRLVEANVKKDKGILEEVLGYAKELRDTWAQAMKLSKQQRPQQIAR